MHADRKGNSGLASRSGPASLVPLRMRLVSPTRGLCNAQPDTAWCIIGCFLKRVRGSGSSVQWHLHLLPT